MTTTSPAHGDGAQRVPLLEKDLDVGSGTTAPPRSRFVPAVATFLAALAVSAVLFVARRDGVMQDGAVVGLPTAFAKLGETEAGGVLFAGVSPPDTHPDGAIAVSNGTEQSVIKTASRPIRALSTSGCKIGYYYHIPKTGGGSLVRYFGHLPQVELLRYESTKFVPVENKTLWFWEHQSSADHWEKFIVPQSLKPGNHLIAHHWGRFGMLGMHKRLQRLRHRAEELGCEFMASVTFREPVDRDVSDETFKRINGVDSGNYLGDEQTRFFLLNSQRVDGRVPGDVNDKPELAASVLSTARTILTENFDLVATIEDLEEQKNAFLKFFDEANTFEDVGIGDGAGASASSTGKETEASDETRKEASHSQEKKEASNAPTAAGAPLQHVHEIDYASVGVDAAEMQRLREKFQKTNKLDAALFETAKAMAVEGFGG